jgi:hypothetical protein
VITSVADWATSGVSLTASLADKPFPASVPVIVATPGATAVIRPEAESTVAIEESLEV